MKQDVVHEGHVAVGGIECGLGVDGAVVDGDDVGLVQHVEHRQPGVPAVDRVLDTRGVVLVLRVVTVKTEVHIGSLAQVEILRLNHGHKVGVAQGGVGDQEVAGGELCLAVDEYRRVGGL